MLDLHINFISIIKSILSMIVIKAINNKGQEVEFKNTSYCSLFKLTKITELPTELKELYCYNNQLTSLPTLPTELKELYCYTNQLTSLPDLRPCTKLKWVNCDLKNFEPYMLDLDINFNFIT